MSTPRSSKLLLLSIHPCHGHKILCGEKNYELRRRAPRLKSDFSVALYATAPVSAVIGIVKVHEILVTSPEALWKVVEEGCCISLEEYAAYFRDSPKAVGIKLTDPLALASPLPLARIRCRWPQFKPPRSFIYLNDSVEIFLRDNLNQELCSKKAAV